MSGAVKEKEVVGSRSRDVLRSGCEKEDADGVRLSLVATLGSRVSPFSSSTAETHTHVFTTVRTLDVDSTLACITRTRT